MKYYHLMWCFVVLIFVSVQVGAKEKLIIPDYYFLSVEASNVSVAVKLNGVPLVSSDDGGVTTENPVTTWIMPGGNTMDIALEALSGQETISGHVEIKLYLHDNASEFPKVKEVLASFAYPEVQGAGVSRVDKVVEFEFARSQPFNLWQEAQVILQINETDKRQMVDVMQGLENALVENDVQKALDLLSYKIQEDALSEHKAPRDVIEAAKHNYSWLASQGVFTSIIFDPANLAFHVVG